MPGGVRLRAGLCPTRRRTVSGSVQMIENGSNSEIGPKFQHRERSSQAVRHPKRYSTDGYSPNDMNSIGKIEPVKSKSAPRCSTSPSFAAGHRARSFAARHARLGIEPLGCVDVATATQEIRESGDRESGDRHCAMVGAARCLSQTAPYHPVGVPPGLVRPSKWLGGRGERHQRQIDCAVFTIRIKVLPASLWAE